MEHRTTDEVIRLASAYDKQRAFVGKVLDSRAPKYADVTGLLRELWKTEQRLIEIAGPYWFAMFTAP